MYLLLTLLILMNHFRLVTGLMDRLEHKMGLEGLRTRVRIVASQVAKTAKGKENIKSPGARTEKVDVLPPPVGNEIPRTPNIPRGKDLSAPDGGDRNVMQYCKLKEAVE